MSAAGASVPVVTTISETHVGRSSDTEEAAYGVITRAGPSWIFVRRRRDRRFDLIRPENVTLLPVEQGADPQESLLDGDLVAHPISASQASLNEIIAGIIRGAPGDRELITTALRALRYHNWASGFTFGGESPKSEWVAQRLDEGAVRAVQALVNKKGWEALRASMEAWALERDLPHEAAALARRRGFRADGAALVYLITHAAYGAAKVGVADTSGSRLAEHRREGWQIVAVFQVTAKAAIAIETDVLRWWRGEMGLPSYLRRDQMPQGGWTETVAAGSVDLAATVTRICHLVVSSPPLAGQ
jgi:hypothetical protein